VTTAVLADMPMDSTSIEDVLHAALLKKEAAKVASTANDMDLWLAAHITDLMLPLSLPESSILSCVSFPFQRYDT
jgi:nuclear pore complex protein Nup85